MKEYLPSDFLPILVLLVAAIGFIVTTIIVTHALGPKRKSELKDAQY
jgi:NADH-quinone oxidoreductase subunit A